MNRRRERDSHDAAMSAAMLAGDRMFGAEASDPAFKRRRFETLAANVLDQIDTQARARREAASIAQRVRDGKLLIYDCRRSGYLPLDGATMHTKVEGSDNARLMRGYFESMQKIEGANSVGLRLGSPGYGMRQADYSPSHTMNPRFLGAQHAPFQKLLTGPGSTVFPGGKQLSAAAEQDASVRSGTYSRYMQVPYIPPPIPMFTDSVMNGHWHDQFLFNKGHCLFRVKFAPDSSSSRRAFQTDSITRQLAAILRPEGAWYTSLAGLNMFLYKQAINEITNPEIVNPFRTASDIERLVNFVGIVPENLKSEARRTGLAILQAQVATTGPVATAGISEEVVNVWMANNLSRVAGTYLGFRVVQIPLSTPAAHVGKQGDDLVPVWTWAFIPFACRDARDLVPAVSARMPLRDPFDVPKIGLIVPVGMVEIAMPGETNGPLDADDMTRLLVPNPVTPTVSINNFMRELSGKGNNLGNCWLRVLIQTNVKSVGFGYWPSHRSLPPLCR